MSAARSFARNKPIIVLKPGRYSESARAALSHTGSMAGGDEIYEAAFRRVGVVRVHEVADLFHAAEVLDSHRLPKGRDVAIVTNAGGLGVMATDALVEHGGRLAPLSDETMASLNAALPPYWSHANPIDVLGDAGSDRFVAAVSACLDDRGVNGILLIYTPQGNARPDEMAERVAELVKDSDKPVITVLMGGETVRERPPRSSSDAGVPCYDTPEAAVKTYLGMYRYAAQPRAALRDARRAPHRRRSATPQPCRRCCAASPRRAGSCSPRRSPSASSRRTAFPVVRQETHAQRRARRSPRPRHIGYPVVLKVVSHDITHKNAAGGVEVGICSPEDLERAYEQHARAREAERARRRDRGRRRAEDGPPRRLRAHPRHEEGPAVRLGHRLRRRRRRRRGTRRLLGEPAAAQPGPRPPHDGGHAHLPVDERAADAASTRPTSPPSTSCSRCCPTSWSTSPRSPRSTSTRS